MRRVVITGMGIVSCLGQDLDSVAASLKEGKSGIRFNPSYAEMGLRSHVSGSVDIDLEAAIDAEGTDADFTVDRQGTIQRPPFESHKGRLVRLNIPNVLPIIGIQNGEFFNGIIFLQLH